MGDERLLHACRLGNLQAVNRLLTKQNVNVRNKMGMTPLLMASKNGNIKIIKLLLRFRAERNAVSKEGSSALHEAVKYGYNPVSVKELVEEGVPIDLQDRQMKSALHIAVERELPYIVEYLLLKGADTGLKDENGRTVLHYASEKKNTKIVQTILKYTKSKKELGICQDINGMTAANIAACKGMYEILELLMNHGCVDFTSCDNDGRSVLHVACEERFNRCALLLLERAPNAAALANLKDNIGDTPLHIAAKLGNGTLAVLLVNHGARVLAKNHVGLSAFSCALIQQHEGLCLFLIPKMLSEQRLIVQEDCLQAEIHLAVFFGMNSVIRSLVDSNVDMSVPDRFNSSALHVAAIHCQKETVDILLEAGVDTGIVNSHNMTAYDVAILLGHGDIAGTLQISSEENSASKESSQTVPMTPISNEKCPEEQTVLAHGICSAFSDVLVGKEMSELGESIGVVELASRAMKNCHQIPSEIQDAEDIPDTDSTQVSLVDIFATGQERTSLQEQPDQETEQTKEINDDEEHVTITDSSTHDNYNEHVFMQNVVPQHSEDDADDLKQTNSVQVIENRAMKDVNIGQKNIYHVNFDKCYCILSPFKGPVIRRKQEERMQSLHLGSNIKSPIQQNVIVNCTARKWHIGDTNIYKVKIDRFVYNKLSTHGMRKEIWNLRRRRKSSQFIDL